MGRDKFSSRIKIYQKFEGNNDTIALNVLYVKQNIKKNKSYKSKYNNNCNKQVILLMICDGEKYGVNLGVTNLSGWLQGNSSNHRGDFYCLNYFNSHTTKNKLKRK